MVAKRMSAIEYIAKSTNISSTVLKNKLFEDGLKEKKCESCEISLWLGKPAPLELHHKDGNHENNDLGNLQVLCSNCHALTHNYCQNKNVGIITSPNDTSKKRCKCSCGNSKHCKSKLCMNCHLVNVRPNSESKIKWPSHEQLQKMVDLDGVSKTGRLLGVHRNTVRKKLIKYRNEK